MSDSTPAPAMQLAAISFDDELKAAEFMTAMTRLARDGRLTLRDAVFVVKSAEGRTYVRRRPRTRNRAGRRSGRGCGAGCSGSSSAVRSGCSSPAASVPVPARSRRRSSTSA